MEIVVLVITIGEGTISSALEFYYLVLGRAQTGPDERRVGEIYLDLAHVYWRLGRPWKSFNYFRSGISQLRRLGLLNSSRIWLEIHWFLKQ